MPLTKTQSEIWQAMDIGPQWVERDKPESLLASPEKGVSVATAPQKEPVTQVVEPAPIARNPALTARVKSAAGDADKHKDSDKAPSGEDNTALQEKENRVLGRTFFTGFSMSRLSHGRYTQTLRFCRRQAGLSDCHCR